MARITLGIGTSHSPILILDGERWEQRAQDDRRNGSLYTLDGRKLTYDQLLAERGEPFGAQSNTLGFPELARQAEAALDQLEARLFDALPDVVLVIGDDQDELFGFDNMPAISVYRGEEVVMKEMPLPHPRLSWADKSFWAGYGMDMPLRFPAAPKLAEDLIRGLIRLGVDVATSNGVPNPGQRAFGHAYGFIYQRLMKRLRVPMLPVLINTYFPPNNPTAARCFEFGSHIAHALAASPIDAKVAVIASGGLSHFLCEESFDREVLRAIKTHDVKALTQIPQESLCSGSSEIRNWISMAGAIGHLRCSYEEYIPVYRTAVGTGIGLGFAAWS
jgi:Catalytic LigB subunit of aromatic ring-opening dioxygenase